MLRGWLFAVGAVALLGGRLLAAEAPPAEKPAEARTTLGKVLVTRAEVAVSIARAMAGSDEKIPTPLPWPSFKDVPETHWAYRYIEYDKSMGVISGDAEGNFEPEAPVDRGQMAIFLARALLAPRGDSGLNLYLPPIVPTFTDVPRECPARVAIEYLADPSRKIVQKTPDGAFHPEQLCTRDDLTALIARAFPPKPLAPPKPGSTPAGSGAAGN